MRKNMQSKRRMQQSPCKFPWEKADKLLPPRRPLPRPWPVRAAPRMPTKSARREITGTRNQREMQKQRNPRKAKHMEQTETQRTCKRPKMQTWIIKTDASATQCKPGTDKNRHKPRNKHERTTYATHNSQNLPQSVGPKTFMSINLEPRRLWSRGEPL